MDKRPSTIDHITDSIQDETEKIEDSGEFFESFREVGTESIGSSSLSSLLSSVAKGRTKSVVIAGTGISMIDLKILNAVLKVSPAHLSNI